MANPGIFPGATALMPQQRERTESDWAPRDYWTQPPNIIPPAPPFEAWVPPPEVIALEESPRDTSRYQDLQAKIGAALAVTPPPPPPVRDTTPQQLLRKESDWALRDYDAHRDTFSILATPIPPIIIGSSLLYGRDMQTWASWALRDYTPYQASSAWFENRQVVNLIPPVDMAVHDYLPPDQTALQLVAQVKRTVPGAAAAKPVPHSTQPQFDIRPYDMTAHFLVLTTSVSQAGIPQVPLGGEFVGFDYEPIDMTPYALVLAGFSIPQAAGAQIPPSLVPFIEWPNWQWGQYQAYQDQFSALGTPSAHIYPKGLVPQFTPEALIRDVSHPTSLYTVQNFIIPPKPPRVFPTPPTFLEWRNWASYEYPLFADNFSAWAALIPPPVPFLVQAVTAGWYNGYYIYPGDVFLLNKASDFSDSTVDYSQGQAATPQYGWMKRVGAGAAVYLTETQVWPTNFPVIDPIPPKRTVY